MDGSCDAPIEYRNEDRALWHEKARFDRIRPCSERITRYFMKRVESGTAMKRNGIRRGDDVLVAALVAGETVQDAASMAGVSVRTAFRRLADTDFQARLETARADIRDRATAKLTESLFLAIDTLDDLMRDGPPTVRLDASKVVLEFARGRQRAEAVDQTTRPSGNVHIYLPDNGRGDYEGCGAVVDPAPRLDASD